jgi:nucleotide-binding universal stress UspA family protein
MFKRILVPLDGAPLAERAVPMAARIARASGGSIVLLRVVNPPVEYGYWAYSMPASTMSTGDWAETDFANARDYLQEIASSSDLAGVNTSIEVHAGQVAAVIFAVTQSHNIDLVVISSHGDIGLKLWVLGSVAQKVARHSTTPILILRERETTPAEARSPRPYTESPLRILVPLDGSALAKEALTPAAQLIAALASPGKAAIHLLRVIKPQPLRGGQEDIDTIARDSILHKAKKYLSSITEHLKEGIASQLKLTVTWSVVFDDDVASAIIRVAENSEDTEGSGVFGGCDLIAISTHGRGGLQRWALGSVTERVLQGTNLPLLIVRSQNHKPEHPINESEAMIIA